MTTMTPAEWDAEKQAEVDASGALKLRSSMALMSLAGIDQNPTHIVYLRGDKLTQIDQLTHQSEPFDPAIMHLPMKVDPEDETRFLVNKEAMPIVVVADRITLRAMIRVFEQSSTSPGTGAVNESDHIARRIRFLSALPFSTFMPTLTDYLQYRYWIPSHLNTDSIGPWVQLMPGTTAVNQASIQTIFASLMTGDAPAWLKRHAAVSALDKEERFAITVASSLGVKSVGMAFNKAENLSAAWEFITNADPDLLERNILDGSVAELAPLGTPSAAGASYVTKEPYKFKEGKKVMLFTCAFGNTDALAGESVTGESEYINGAIQATTVGNKAPQFAAISLAMINQIPLYMVAQPFLSFSSAGTNTRWTDRGFADPERPIPKRSVPLEVILAGAPTSA